VVFGGEKTKTADDVERGGHRKKVTSKIGGWGEQELGGEGGGAPEKKDL